MTDHPIYVSLDEARALLRERWNDASMKARVEAELGARFIPVYGAKPLAVCHRQLSSADNGLAFFHQCAKYIGAAPLVQEFLGDTFVTVNEEKKGLGRLRVTLEDGSNVTVDIIKFPANENLEIGECTLISGANLAKFHHSLLKLDDYELEIYDNTLWHRRIGRAADYYHPLLLHFVAHAVLFDNYPDQDGSAEARFTREVVLPAIERIRATFGLAPLIVRAYPEDQTDEEDFYWWSHSPKMNRYLLNYAREYGLKIKPCRFGSQTPPATQVRQSGDR